MIPVGTPLLIAVAITVVPVASGRARLERGVLRGAASPTSRSSSVSRLRALVQRCREAGEESGLRAVLVPFGAAVLAGCALLAVTGWVAALVGSVVTAAVVHRASRSSATDRSDPLRLAAGWDLLAAGLRAGLSVPVAVRSVADELTGTAAVTLLRVADQLVLGADPVAAWEPALDDPDTAELARAARRSARSGSGLAAVAGDIATRHRSSMEQRAQARVQRASVWVAAPLALCFLPAFLCLGVLPVVVGMVEQMRMSW